MHYDPSQWIREPQSKRDYMRITQDFDEEVSHNASMARSTQQIFYRERAGEIQSLKEQWLSMYDHLYHNLPD